MSLKLWRLESTKELSGEPGAVQLFVQAKSEKRISDKAASLEEIAGMSLHKNAKTWPESRHTRLARKRATHVLNGQPLAG